MSLRRTLCIILSLVVLFTFASPGYAAESNLEDVVDKLVGVPYKWGGVTPKGFDCSGFILYVYKQFGYSSLPRTSKSQAKMGQTIAKKDLQPGDLVFFNTNGKGISHAGIYLGNDIFIHSSRRGVVKDYISKSAYYSKRYVTAKRILPTEEWTGTEEADEEDNAE
jgi:cell wall-associated NlpC family hydrolase